MGDRKRNAGGGQTSRANRAWKDETNPFGARDDPAATEEEQPLSTGSPDPNDPPAPAPRRAQAGREDQGGTWQTGPGSGGATESAGRRREHAGQSDQAGPKR
jgi:hypothetical protein